MVTTLVDRLVLAMVGGALLLASAVLLSTGAASADNASLPEVLGYLGLAVGSGLALRVVAAVVRDGYS